MHGFALNVNPDLSYYSNIVPCGIQDETFRNVTSMEKELNQEIVIHQVIQPNTTFHINFKPCNLTLKF